MTDNSPSSGGSGDIIATDDLSSINGAAASGFKVQRVKVGYGADGDFNDVSATQGLPITSTPAQNPQGLPVYNDTLNTLIAGNSISRDQRSLLDVLDPLSDDYVAPKAEMLGSQGKVFDQLPEGGIRTGLTTRNYSGFSNAVGTVMVQTVFCGDMNSFSVAWRSAAAVQIDVQIMLPDGSWASVWGNVAGQTINVGSGSAPNNSGGQPAFFSGLLYGAQYVRLVHLAAAGTVRALMQLSNGPPATFQIAGALTVQQPTAGNLTCTANANIGYVAQTTGGAAASVAAVMSPATPAATVIKSAGAAARLLGWQFHNSATGLRSVKVFNTNAPTLGTSTAMFEIDIPASTSVSFRCEGGLNLNVGSTYSVTAAKGLTDNTATGLAANDVSGFFFYA